MIHGIFSRLYFSLSITSHFLQTIEKEIKKINFTTLCKEMHHQMYMIGKHTTESTFTSNKFLNDQQ